MVGMDYRVCGVEFGIVDCSGFVEMVDSEFVERVDIMVEEIVEELVEELIMLFWLLVIK